MRPTFRVLVTSEVLDLRARLAFVYLGAEPVATAQHRVRRDSFQPYRSVPFDRGLLETGSAPSTAVLRPACRPCMRLSWVHHPSKNALKRPHAHGIGIHRRPFFPQSACVSTSANRAVENSLYHAILSRNCQFRFWTKLLTDLLSKPDRAWWSISTSGCRHVE